MLLYSYAMPLTLTGHNVARYYLRDVKRLISGWRKTSRAEKILILLLESGSLYCILWASPRLPMSRAIMLILKQAVRFGIDMYDGAASSERRQLGLLLARMDEIATDLHRRRADIDRTLDEIAEVAVQCRVRLRELA